MKGSSKVIKIPKVKGHKERRVLREKYFKTVDHREYKMKLGPLSHINSCTPTPKCRSFYQLLHAQSHIVII
jgi:hypothetical protein